MSQPQVFLINLDRQKDRRDFMQGELARRSVQFVRISAVDGKTAGEGELRRLSDEARANLSPGEIGCILSHVECWQRIVDGDIPCGCIIEDDVRFGDNIVSALSDAKVAADDRGIHRLESNLLTVDAEVEPLKTRNGRSLYRLIARTYSTGAYVLSRRTALELLENFKSFTAPIDIEIMGNVRETLDLPIYQWIPAPFVQDARLGRRSVFGDTSAIGYDRQSLHKSRLRLGINRMKDLIRPAYYSLKPATRLPLGNRIFVTIDQSI